MFRKNKGIRVRGAGLSRVTQAIGDSPVIRRHRRRHIDYLIIFCVTFLVLLGLVMLSSASSNLGKNRFDDSYYYLKHQMLYGLSLGLIGFFAASKIYYRNLERLAVPMLLLSILLLFLVFGPLGIAAGGAERWLKIGPISFQPAELIKITLVVYLAAWLGRRRDRLVHFFTGFLPFFIVLSTICFLLIKQPSTSSAAIIIAVSLIIYFASGARISYILGAFAIGAIGLALLVYITPYRLERIKTFLNPTADALGSGYQINQTLIAIGNGGMWGTGYGQSTTKIYYLPEPIGDSIFAVIAEELGFIGSIGIIAIFLILITRTFFIAARARDRFGQLLMVGFGSLIAIQFFINIAAVSGVIPFTGAPLPFISYGGTALAVFMTIGGIIYNVSRYG